MDGKDTVKGFLKFLIRYISDRKRIFIAYLLFLICFFTVFYLYNIDIKATVYPTVLCTVILLMFFIADVIKNFKLHVKLKNTKNIIDWEELPFDGTQLSEDYGEIIKNLISRLNEKEATDSKKYGDMIDYFTVWAHQIKTPIATMCLSLQREDGVNKSKLRSELAKTEQYAEMVLAYLRLGSSTTDFLFEETDIDRLIRENVKKFSYDFIQKKIKLIYEPVCIKTVTDEKWLSFCIEQVISNAVKYTFSGSISVIKTDENVISVQDTGIGIAKEDLPRVFENGYTGINGRRDKKASGIGLHLVKRICDNLGIKVYIRSEAGKGTQVYFDFSRK